MKDLTEDQQREITDVVIEGTVSKELRQVIADHIRAKVPNALSNADDNTAVLYALGRVTGGFVGVTLKHLPMPLRAQVIDKILLEHSDLVRTMAYDAAGILEPEKTRQ